MAFMAVFGLVASPTMALDDWPSACCAAFTFFAFRPTATTLAPSATNALAADKPMPVVPPMTTRTLPCSIDTLL